jgi:hypothetical protein
MTNYRKYLNIIMVGSLMAVASLSSAQTASVPRPHVEPIIPHPKKVVLTPEQLQQIVVQHQMIGKQLVSDCFDSQLGHVCLDEIVSYVGKDKEDYVEFRIIKANQTPTPGEYPYRVSIYLDKDSKIKTVKIKY